MATISEDQRQEIQSLLKRGLDRDVIAARVGVSPGTVSAIKAHLTMGTYGGTVTETETEELIEATETTFSLERDLQVALRSNIQQLEAGLQIVDDGKERTCDAGRIDITARDVNGTTVVIELKAGKAAPEALTQLLAYMGALGEEEGKPVRGILIAGDFHHRVLFASHAVPAVQLQRYGFKFTFERIH